MTGEFPEVTPITQKPALPEIAFTLKPETGLSHIGVFHDLTRRLLHIAENAGSLSTGFQYRLKTFRDLPETADLPKMLRSPQDIRVLVKLWREDDEFLRKHPVDTALLKRFRLLRKTPSVQILTGMLELYFARFDGAGNLQALIDYLREQLDRFTPRELTGILQKSKTHQYLLLGVNAPDRVIEAARREGKSLDDTADALGIPPNPSGRFLQLCRAGYFLWTITNLHPGRNDRVFSEVIKPEIKESPYRDGLLLGHVVMMVMIDRLRAARSRLPENWMRVLIAVGGDPREPEDTPEYRKWWGALDPAYAEFVRGWLP